MKGDYFSKDEMQLATKLATKSRQYFDKTAIAPALNLNLIAPTHPDRPRHPHQKYYLTKLGKAMQKYLTENK